MPTSAVTMFANLSELFNTMGPPLIGIICAVLCSVSFAVEDMLLFGMSESEKHPAVIFVFNSVVALAISLVLAAIMRPPLKCTASHSHTLFVVLHGLCNTAAQVAISYAIFILGPGNAVAIFFIMPVFTNCADVLIMGNKCVKATFLFTVLAFAGVVLLSHPGIDSGDEVGVAEMALTLKLGGITCAGLGALFFSCSLFLGGKLSELGTPVVVTLLSYSGQYSIIAALWCTAARAWEIPSDTMAILALSATGVATLFGMAMHFLAVSFQSPVVVSVVLPLHVVFAYAGQYALYTFPFTWMIGLGGALIIVSCIGVALTQESKTKSESEEQNGGDIKQGLIDKDEESPFLPEE